MPVRLKAEEQSADVVVRKGKYDYRIYPISDVALRWLKARWPHAMWKTIDGKPTMTASRAEAAHLVADIRHSDFRVCGGLSG